MPRQASELMIQNEGLLQVCEELRMNANGSSDTLSLLYDEAEEKRKERYINILETAIEHWEHSDSAYDKAVKDLIFATLGEVHRVKHRDLWCNHN